MMSVRKTISLTFDQLIFLRNLHDCKDPDHFKPRYAYGSGHPDVPTTWTSFRPVHEPWRARRYAHQDGELRAASLSRAEAEALITASRLDSIPLMTQDLHAHLHVRPQSVPRRIRPGGHSRSESNLSTTASARRTRLRSQPRASRDRTRVRHGNGGDSGPRIGACTDEEADELALLDEANRLDDQTQRQNAWA